MGLLVGCAMLPMALALLVIAVTVSIQEPLSLLLLILFLWIVRDLWRAHRAWLRRGEEKL